MIVIWGSWKRSSGDSLCSWVSIWGSSLWRNYYMDLSIKRKGNKPNQWFTPSPPHTCAFSSVHYSNLTSEGEMRVDLGIVTLLKEWVQTSQKKNCWTKSNQTGWVNSWVFQIPSPQKVLGSLQIIQKHCLFRWFLYIDHRPLGPLPDFRNQQSPPPTNLVWEIRRGAPPFFSPGARCLVG